MAWSYRKRKKVAPGVYLNFSKKGISTSFGVKGFSITTGPRGTYLNTGIPGTGLYNRQKISGKTKSKPNSTTTINEEQKVSKYEIQGSKRTLLWFLFVSGLLASIGGVLTLSDNKGTLQSSDLIFTIFIAIVTMACFIGLRKKNTPRDIGKQLGNSIAKQIINNYCQPNNSTKNEKKDL